MGKTLSNKRKIALQLSVCVALLSPNRAHAALGDVQLKMDTAEIDEQDAINITRLVRSRMGTQLEKRGLTLSGEGSDRIEIMLEYLDESDLEYAIHVDLYRAGEAVAPGIEWFTCVACNDSMVVDAIAKRTPAIIELLTYEAPPSLATTPDVEVPVVDAPRKITPWGISGAVVLAGGLGLTVGGAVLFPRATKVAETGSGESLGMSNYRKSGAILLGLGVGLMAVGAIALAADMGVQGKRRRRFFGTKKGKGARVEPGPLGITLRF